MGRCVYSQDLYSMTPIVILNVNAVRALELRDQLQDSGLIQNQDFEWEYRQAEYNNFSYEANIPRHVMFRFRDPVQATFWQLKWS
jgi:hypothetical protein